MVTGAPASAINLIDADRQVSFSTVGLQRRSVPRDDSMCNHAISEGASIYVTDARDDERFVDNPFVTGEIAELRLYAAAPITTPDGHAIGSLCVVDTEVRALTANQREALDDLAAQAVQLFELHRHADELTATLTELDHLAAHDALTGLANRRRFTGVVDGRLTSDTGPAGDLLVFGDLDGFKAVNDEHGHAAGDEVLRVVADRLRAATRPEDLVARLGGDEFAVLCPDTPADHADGLLDRLRDVVAQPITVHGQPVSVGFSIGSARAAEGDDIDALLREADAAMYEDKRARAGR
ncbi:sensor domain-containing diguanylate cyclase [Aquihabitans sp. G128]|uniref:sensor domain-containing diguanylate cyclase n=1 Tax=Aquihabitans sp. G128 TaxID=2849779 RepID=UPI001C221590|nr:sensor domain-containing diguanylate cyclase [Aquihabitans sp. G128]